MCRGPQHHSDVSQPDVCPNSALPSTSDCLSGQLPRASSFRHQGFPITYTARQPDRTYPAAPQSPSGGVRKAPIEPTVPVTALCPRNVIPRAPQASTPPSPSANRAPSLQPLCSAAGAWVCHGGGVGVRHAAAARLGARARLHSWMTSVSNDTPWTPV
jgi:hypothetical protein